jgi:hypothetical protein
MRPGVPDVHITDPQDTELAAYRALPGQAVLGLIFGLLAPLAMVDPLLWIMPALGAVMSWWALRRIRDNAPAMAGRGMAWAGLTLSLLLLAAAPTDWLLYRGLIRREAQQFSALWFRYLLHDEPQKAHQLTTRPQFREALDARLWAVYRNSPELRGDLENYVKRPLVRTLLALGPRAQVRYYDTIGQSHEGGREFVEQAYAVTYEEEGQRKSFFVVVRLARMKFVSGEAGWRILQTEAGVRPEGW